MTIAPSRPGRTGHMRNLMGGTALAVLLAAPASAATLTVTGLAVSADPGFTVSVPTVEVVDGNIDEAAIRALFSGQPAPGLEALAALDAAALNIPELSFTFTGLTPGDSTPLVVTYRDLALSGVTDGIASAARIGSAEMSGPEGVTGTFGAMTTDTFDLGAMLRFYGMGTGSAPAGAGFTPVYTNFVFSGGSFTSPEVSCSFGASTATGFSARPLRHAMSELQGFITAIEAAEKAGTPPAPEVVAGLIAFYVDLLTAFETSPVSVEGFDCTGTDEKGNAMVIASGPIRVGGYSPGLYPEVSLDDFKIDVANDGFMSLGNFTWKKMDISGVLATLESAGGDFSEAWLAANWRKLVPIFDGASLRDFAMDIPDESRAGERIVAKLGTFDATFANYVNGLPADIDLSVGDLLVPVPPAGSDQFATDLRAAGITEFNLSLGTALAWNVADSTITVSELLVDAGALGRIHVSGTLGNATEALFADDVMEASVAAQLLTVKDVTIEIEDRGAAELIMTAAARESGQPVPMFRTAISGMIQGMTLAVLGNTDEALAAAQALGTFLGGAPSLKLTLTAVDPAGLGLADFAAAGTDPTALAGKFTVTAVATGAAAPDTTTPAPDTEAPAVPSIQEQKLGLKNPAPST